MSCMRTPNPEREGREKDADDLPEAEALLAAVGDLAHERQQRDRDQQHHEDETDAEQQQAL